MALLHDTDFLLHRLRLAYLKSVDDPYGSRIISLDPSYQTNSYILASSLADTERWPELGLPSSPNLSEDEEPAKAPETSSKARLRHSKLLGNRHAARRNNSNNSDNKAPAADSTPKATSEVQAATQKETELPNFILANAPVQEAALTTATPRKTAPSHLRMGSWIDISNDDEDEEDESPTVKVNVQGPSAQPEPAPVTKVVQFIPKFKGAAEMEARRRLRMAARRGPQGPAAQPAKPLTFDDTSSEEEIMVTEDSSSDDFEDVGIAVTEDIGDEFDPDFAATHMSTGMPPPSPSPREDTNRGTNHQAQARHHPQHQSSQTTNKPEDTLHPKRPADPNTTTTNTNTAFRPRLDSTNSITGTSNQELVFTKKKLPSSSTTTRPPLRSALSAKLASSTSSNPFSELYSTISGRESLSSARTVEVYFPHAEQPRGKALVLTIRADATVEEVIGFALWSYWEERWEPKLDEGLGGENDPRWKIRLSTVGWVLRMAEDDGEVDDDCPAPDRAKKAKDFLDIYAILEATPTQIQQNQILESQLQRRAETVSAPKKLDKLNLPPSMTLPSLASGNLASFAGVGSMLSASPGLSSSHGMEVLLRVHTADAIQILTTIKVYSGTYMQEALELVCRRQRINNPSDYALLLADKSLVIPLDRTVASLQGKKELSLVRKSMLPQLGLKNIGKTTDPNASIFTKPKRLSENNDQELSRLDFTAAYKKFTIYRKIPMLVTRQERTLAIDGDYIHIMPSTSKARALLDSGKTASYHITTIANCSQSNKNSAIFKLILVRAATSMPKRYDFEAESPKVAADIVSSIKNLKAALDRNGTLQKSRRSRQIV